MPKKSRKKSSVNHEDSDSDYDLAKMKAEFGVKQTKTTGGGKAGIKRAKDDGDEKTYKRRIE